MRVLIVDDHALFRAGIALLLARLDGDVDVVEAAGIEPALALAGATAPRFDLVLLDLNLGGTGGLEGLRAIREGFPGSTVIILSALESRDAMHEARAKGARGYLLKSVSADAMLDALRKVLAGDSHFPSIEPADTGDATLTPRQFEVLKLLCEGRTNKEIAQRLGMSENTVRSHLMFVFRAFGTRTRTETANAARRQGLV